jgi:hypothetical protein
MYKLFMCIISIVQMLGSISIPVWIDISRWLKDSSNSQECRILEYIGGIQL